MDLLTQMIEALPLGSRELTDLVASAPRRYKVYSIPKRTPGEFRVIAHPARELKLVQRWLLKNVLNDLPIHSAAMAYRKGISILDNAEKHVHQRYLLKLDITNFFPSIKPRDFIKHCAIHLPKLTEQDLEVLTQILFRRDPKTKGLELSIGAPSSPLVSNSIFLAIDSQIDSHCKQLGIVYTRYADDMTFSTNRPNVLNQIPQFVAEALEKTAYPKLKLNAKKTTHASTKHRRQVTGLILTPDSNVSIGREKKRTLKALVHRFSIGQLSAEELANLRGQLSFVISVEPAFVERLREKYSKELIHKIFE